MLLRWSILKVSTFISLRFWASEVLGIVWLEVEFFSYGFMVALSWPTLRLQMPMLVLLPNPKPQTLNFPPRI